MLRNHFGGGRGGGGANVNERHNCPQCTVVRAYQLPGGDDWFDLLFPLYKVKGQQVHIHIKEGCSLTYDQQRLV